MFIGMHRNGGVHAYWKTKQHWESPKILLVDERTTCTLLFQDQNITKSKNDEGWSRYLIEDMQVFDEESDEQMEGTNEIPFYGMEAFFDAYISLNNKQLKDDIIFAFVRTKVGSKNRFKFTVDM